MIAPGVMVCTWEQGTLQEWPCIASILLGMGRQKSKLSTSRQKKNNPFLGQDYSDYQQMMLKQEYQLIRGQFSLFLALGGGFWLKFGNFTPKPKPVSSEKPATASSSAMGRDGKASGGLPNLGHGYRAARGAGSTTEVTGAGLRGV